MTSRVIRGGEGAKYPGELTAIIISCDRMGCTKSVNDRQIEKAGGLTVMGWSARAIAGVMRHYCPKHK